MVAALIYLGKQWGQGIPDYAILRGMKVVILAGGFGTRLSEETVLKPKPMVEIGGRPILWHIMSHYSHYGFNEFVVALGYKGYAIKDYFIHYHQRQSNFSVSLKTGDVQYTSGSTPDWKVHLIETGKNSMTGGRLHRLQDILGDEPFMMTYGDGLCDVDLKALKTFHEGHGKMATVTAVSPAARFGDLMFDGDRVSAFKEKAQAGAGWINGGFFVLNPGVFDYLNGDATVFEKEPLERLVADQELMSFKHQGFWQCMDTLRDKNTLESIWESGDIPWKYSIEDHVDV